MSRAAEPASLAFKRSGPAGPLADDADDSIASHWHRQARGRRRFRREAALDLSGEAIRVFKETRR